MKSLAMSVLTFLSFSSIALAVDNETLKAALVAECGVENVDDIEITHSQLEAEFELSVGWKIADSDDSFTASVLLDEGNAEEVFEVVNCGE